MLPRGMHDRIALELSVRSLRRSRGRANTVEEICRLTHDWTGYGPFMHIKSLQHLEEQVSLFDLVQSRPIRNALEIGTCNGGTLFPLLALTSPDAHIISIDLPGGIHGGGYDASWAEFFHRAFRGEQQTLDLIRGNSQSSETLKRVQQLLKGELLDYLFIDGDHRFEGVKRDFLLYGPLVKRGGLIAFHDIDEELPVATVDVPRFWREIKGLAPTVEFIRQQRHPPYYGIGVFPEWNPAILSQIPV